MSMGTIVVAGGTGLIGTPLVKKLLDVGYEVILLTRRPSEFHLRHPKLKPVAWDGKTLGAWGAEVEAARAIINLCGAGILDDRWTPERKRELLNSRIHPLQALVQAAVRCALPPKTLISASAVGFYGDVPPNQAVTESHLRGAGFLADTCVQWEKAAQTAESFGIRTLFARFGIVLAPQGGALPKFVKPFRIYLGGGLGSGRQILPWIHVDDAIAAILHMLEKHDLSGPVNVTSPHPQSMGDFCRTLGRVMGRPSWLSVPGPAVRMLMGEASEAVLTGQRALPRKLMDAGFKFKHPDLEKALKELLEKKA